MKKLFYILFFVIQNTLVFCQVVPLDAEQEFRKLAFSQLPTMDSSVLMNKNMDTIKIKRWEHPNTRSLGKKEEYFLGSKKVTKATYDSAWTDKTIEFFKCYPCYLKVYNSKGQLIRESAQCGESSIGPYIEYYLNGKMKMKGNYKVDAIKGSQKYYVEKDGVWEYYRMDGTISKKEIWKDSKLISTK